MINFSRSMLPNGPGPTIWILSAFYKNKHYSFIKLPAGPNLVKEYLTYIMMTFWPILHIDYLCNSTSYKDGVGMTWTTIPL